MRHSEGPVYRRCKSERGAHCFSQYNNMDRGEQPHILRVLTQVEEILISRVNPILQVTHARGGKYKYIGHTISFLQDISTIVRRLPQRVEDIEFLIMRRHGAESKYYECYVKISQVMDAFLFKIQCDHYYRDVVIDYDSMNALPEGSIDASSRLKFVDFHIEESELNETNNEEFHAENFTSHPSSFVSHLPNECREVEETREFLDNFHSSHVQYMDWPTI